MIILLKTLLPLFSGFITGIIKSKMESSSRQQELTLQLLGANEKSRRRAGKIKDKKVAWTRRTLALMFSSTFLGLTSTLVLAGIFNPEMVLNVPQELTKHSLFSFIGLGSPNVINGYVELKGAVLVLPLMETLLITTQAIIGFYFGQAMSNRR